MKQLVAIFIKSLVSEHFSMEVETFNIAVALNLVWFDATASLGFPVTLPGTFLHRIQAYSILHTQFPLQSQTCNRPGYHQKPIKFT